MSWSLRVRGYDASSAVQLGREIPESEELLYWFKEFRDSYKELFRITSIFDNDDFYEAEWLMNEAMNKMNPRYQIDCVVTMSTAIMHGLSEMLDCIQRNSVNPSKYFTIREEDEEDMKKTFEEAYKKAFSVETVDENEFKALKRMMGIPTKGFGMRTTFPDKYKMLQDTEEPAQFINIARSMEKEARKLANARKLRVPLLLVTSKIYDAMWKLYAPVRTDGSRRDDPAHLFTKNIDEGIEKTCGNLIRQNVAELLAK